MLIDFDTLKDKKGLLKKLINYRNTIINKFYSNAKKILFNEKFSYVDLNKVIKRRNKNLFRALSKDKILNFKNFFKSIKKNKKYLIIGTRDHTSKLFKLLKKFNNKHRNIYFYEFKSNDFKNSKECDLKNIKRITKFDIFSWSNVLISSHQFQDEIKNFLVQKKIFNFDGFYKNYQTNIIDSY